jgi:hypothetical protein
MSTNHEVTLNPGDSAVIVRHEDGEDAGRESFGDEEVTVTQH